MSIGMSCGHCLFDACSMYSVRGAVEVFIQLVYCFCVVLWLLSFFFFFFLKNWRKCFQHFSHSLQECLFVFIFNFFVFDLLAWMSPCGGYHRISETENLFAIFIVDSVRRHSRAVAENAREFLVLFAKLLESIKLFSFWQTVVSHWKQVICGDDAMPAGFYRKYCGNSTISTTIWFRFPPSHRRSHSQCFFHMKTISNKFLHGVLVCSMHTTRLSFRFDATFVEMATSQWNFFVHFSFNFSSMLERDTVLALMRND